MRCINKLISLLALGCISLCFVGCGQKETFATYDVFDSSYKYGVTNNSSSVSSARYFASDLCVTGADDIGVSSVDSYVASAAGAFNLDTQEVIYAQSIFEQMYPASTTKILTCLVAIENGDLDAYYTVSANAVKQAADSSTIKLKEGDIITLRDLLYGLMLKSGNDAAIAIAEAVSGDVDSFMLLMNERAAEIGATNTNFVTPNGLHDENHYTTVYDMYLIMNEALKNEEFYSIFTTTSKDVAYTDKSGKAITATWNTTNQYFTNNVNAPSGFTIVGGKTGTTGAAGYCLVLLSENEAHERIISIVFNADGRSNLYYLMNQILSEFGN